jgi:hypothetical protein
VSDDLFDDRVNGFASVLNSCLGTETEKRDRQTAKASTIRQFQPRDQGPPNFWQFRRSTESGSDNRMNNRVDSTLRQTPGPGCNRGSYLKRGCFHQLAFDLLATRESNGPGRSRAHDAANVRGVQNRLNWLIDKFTSGWPNDGSSEPNHGRRISFRHASSGLCLSGPSLVSLPFGTIQGSLIGASMAPATTKTLT